MSQLTDRPQPDGVKLIPQTVAEALAACDKRVSISNNSYLVSYDV